MAADGPSVTSTAVKLKFIFCVSVLYVPATYLNTSALSSFYLSVLHMYYMVTHLTHIPTMPFFTVVAAPSSIPCQHLFVCREHYSCWRCSRSMAEDIITMLTVLSQWCALLMKGVVASSVRYGHKPWRKWYMEIMWIVRHTDTTSMKYLIMQVCRLNNKKWWYHYNSEEYQHCRKDTIRIWSWRRFDCNESLSILSGLLYTE